MIGRNRGRSRIEEVLRVEGSIAEKFVEGPVKLVGARSERHVDDGRSTSVPGRSCARLHFELLNRIYGRIENENVSVCIHALNSVEEIDPHVGRITVDDRS